MGVEGCVKTAFPSVMEAIAFQVESTEAERAEGKELFHFYCSVCHGPMAVAGGSIPDLRHLPESKHALFEYIVLGGLLQRGGMPAFPDQLDSEQVRFVQAWILEQARLASRPTD